MHSTLVAFVCRLPKGRPVELGSALVLHHYVRVQPELEAAQVRLDPAPGLDPPALAPVSGGTTARPRILGPLVCLLSNGSLDP